jgi:hypothetical protein
MATSVLKHEQSRVQPGTFAPPKLLWSESKDQWKLGIRYMDIYSEKKKGFMSGDFPRRDEFANTIRTEQIREILKHETHGQRVAHKKWEQDVAKLSTAVSTATTVLQSYVPVNMPAASLYDVTMRIPEPSLKLARNPEKV